MASLAPAALGAEPDASQLRDPNGTVVAADRFGRFVDGQWGRAEVGGAYQYASAEPRFGVRSDMGWMGLASPGDWQSSLLARSTRDVDVRLQVSLSSLPKAGYARISVLLRRQASGAEFRATVIVSSRGTMSVRLTKHIGGATEVLGTTAELSGVSVTAGSRFWIRANVRGVVPTTLRVRTWLASRTEPSVWNLVVGDRTAALQSPGVIGIRSSISRTTTFAPLSVQVDSLRVTDVSSSTAQAMPPSEGSVVADAFDRTVTRGWESAPLGGNYTLSGPSADFSIAGGVGLVTVPAAGTSRGVHLSSISQRDVRLHFVVDIDKLPSNYGHQFAYGILRRGGGEHYLAKVVVAGDGPVFLQLSRVGGCEVALTSQLRVDGVTYRPGSRLHVRAFAQGSGPTKLAAKAWLSGQNEPAGWLVTALDSRRTLQDAGSVGLETYTGRRVNNSPIVVSFDDFVVDPETSGEPPSATPTPSPSATPTPSPSATPTPDPSPTPTPSPSQTPTPSPSQTGSDPSSCLPARAPGHDAVGLGGFQCASAPTGVRLDVTNYGATPNDDSDDDAAALRAAIRAAGAGSEVYVPAGRYTLRSGGIALKSGVSLRGESRDATVFVTNMSTTVQYLFQAFPGTTNVQLTDFTVRQAAGVPVDMVIRLGSGRWDTSNAEYSLVERVTITRLTLSGFQRMGISLENTRHVLVWNNQISNATAFGGGGQGYGVALSFDRASENWIIGNSIGPAIRHAVLLQYRTHNNLIELNTTNGTTQDAFDLHGEDEHHNELRHNVVASCSRVDPATGATTYPSGFGIGESPSSGATGMAAHDVTGPFNWIHHNEVRAGCYGGVRINNTNNTFVEDNTLTGNAFGIRVGDLNASDDAWLLRNTVTGNSVGILLGAADGVVVRNNSATGNPGYGLDVVASANQYTITNNDFRMNRVRLTSSDGVFQENQL